MKEEKKLEKLIRLKEAKNDLIKAFREDLQNKIYYNIAKEKYNKYADIYREITDKDPDKTFDDLLLIKMSK